MFGLICVLLLLAHQSASQLTGPQIDTLKTLHNNVRANPTSIGSPPPASPLGQINWDSNIAADAQSWASQCRLAYSANYASTHYGENLVYSYPPEYFDVTKAFNYWVAGGQYFNFTNSQCRGNKNCANWQQIVATSTTAFGCGAAQCNFGTPSVWLVCNYKSFAQYPGTNPYSIDGRPATPRPSTPAPSTPAPSTPAPSTPAPSTPAPSTPKPATQKPPTPKPPTQAPATPAPSTPAPSQPCSGYCTIDYRNSYLVQSVKNQQQCGSCWAFGATALAEAAVAMKLGSTIAPLSEQSVLDCSSSGSCNGGWPPTALGEMISRGSVDTMSSYPYTQVKAACKSSPANSGGSITKKFTVKGSMDAFYQALKTYGPIGIAVYADTNIWYSYRQGLVSYSATSSQINHAVTIVGYDATNNAWIVRNSWGASWGQSGYILLDVNNPAGAYVQGAWYATA